ncbi:hypothetical protein HDV00_010574 [Rhizophlyctis rosea]|nr:hypothetical protein HDV00_010574 [Rhizophlyctis rosea]
MDRRGLAYLGHALAQGSLIPPAGATLEVLRLDSCRLKAQSLEIIAPGIRRSRLKHLSLRNNRLTADCGPPLSEMIRRESGQNKQMRNRLQTLDLRGNQLKHGVAYVAKALARNRRLKNLSLRDNKLDSIDLCSIAEALRSNKGLEVLDLSGNMMSGENDMHGIMMLKDALSLNKKLRELSLANTNIGSEATIALAEALPLTTSIQRLHLAYNPLGLAGAMALAVSLKMNQSITSLEIAPSLGKSSGYEEDEELARLMNDIVIYCQRNATILKAQEEKERAAALARGEYGVPKGDDEDEEESDEEMPPKPPRPSRRSSSPPPPPSAPDPVSLRKDMDRAVETAMVLTEMIQAGGAEENQEVLQQLYEDTKAFQVQLHQLVNNNMGMEEELLGTILSVNDVLDQAVKQYETTKLGRPPSLPHRSDSHHVPTLPSTSSAASSSLSTSQPSTASAAKPAPTPNTSQQSPSSGGAPPQPLVTNDSIGSIDLGDLDEGTEGGGAMDADVQQMTGDEFMAELDDQMKEIDDFLNATASPTKGSPTRAS